LAQGDFSARLGRAGWHLPDGGQLCGIALPEMTSTSSSSVPGAGAPVPPLQKGTAPTRPNSGDDSKRLVVVQGFEKKSGLGKRVSEELERGVLEVACPNGERLAEGSENFKAYKSQYKRLCTHLRQNANLVKRLASGELAAKRVAAMGDEALMAESQRSELEQIRQENLHDALGITAEDSAHWTPSDNYTCPRCGSVECIYIQTIKGSHSYDDNNQEPTITIRCTACKHLWKEDEVEIGGNAAGSFAIEEPKTLPKPADGVAGSATGGAVPAKAPTETPSLWHETERQRAPTWLLPAKETDATTTPGRFVWAAPP